MNTERMITELESVAEKYRNKITFTGEVNITAMCEDVLPKLRQLKEYEDLEEQGLLLKLPYKVGDTLYYPYIDDTTKEKVISKEKVTDIGLHYSVEKDGGYLSNCSEIRKIIFLTQAEAEEKLKKIESEE